MSFNAGNALRLAAVTAFALVGASTAADALPPPQASPTCSDTMGITVHGQHIVGDYVMGTGSGDLSWPPDGADVGQVVSDNGGAAIPGGPGPGFHFPNGIAPGASFCNDSNSPGAHL